MNKHPNAIRSLTLSAALILTVLLGACAPQAAPQKETLSLTQQVTQVNYYPREAGLVREYIGPNDDPKLAARLTVSEQGPRSIRNQVLFTTHQVGRGKDILTYREHNGSGVFIHREDHPGQTTTYDPPLQEFPSSKALLPGKKWAGRSTVTIAYDKNDMTHTVDIVYRYAVLEERNITINNQEYTALVINFEAEEVNNPRGYIQNQTWFVPHLGYIRTNAEEYLLTTNYRKAN